MVQKGKVFIMINHSFVRQSVIKVRKLDFFWVQGEKREVEKSPPYSKMQFWEKFGNFENMSRKQPKR